MDINRNIFPIAFEPVEELIDAAYISDDFTLADAAIARNTVKETNMISRLVNDAMMPFFTLAIVLFGIETVFDMLWREHKKAKRERERVKKREKRRLEYQDRRMANDAEHAKETRAMRYDVLRRDGFHCVRCGRGREDGVKLHVDHVIPVSRGGKSVMDNLQTLCEDCNCGKGNKYVE